MATGSTKDSLARVKEQKRVTLFLNPLILKQAKVQAVVEEVTLTSLVEKALLGYFSGVK